jgi:uroporphyrinogen decarboxylase
MLPYEHIRASSPHPEIPFPSIPTKRKYMTMNHRERYLAAVLGQPIDRAPYYLSWGPWRTTWERWEREGKPAEITDHRSFMDPDVPPQVLYVDSGPCPELTSGVIEEDEVSFVHYDSWGIKRRDYKHTESMSEFISFPVTNRSEWEEFKTRYLNPHDPRRLETDWRTKGAEWMRLGYPIQLGYYPDAGVFGPYRWLLGDEEGLVALRTMPDLAHEIMDHITTLYLTVWEQVVREIRIDVIHLWEDMCYVAGPLISPRMWEEFLGPNYRRIRAFADTYGIPVISVDTDGQPDKIVPPMIRSGVNLLLPLEVAAGCDIHDYQLRYPELAFSGAIDKRALAQDHAAIDRELERIRPAIQHSRYIPELDHLIPDDVSWDNYCYFAARLKNIIGKS